MKTPREILVDHHRHMEDRLDAIRQRAIAMLGSTDRTEARKEGGSDFAWWELVLSLRWHLAAMSALWVVALVLNFDHSPRQATKVAAEQFPSPRQVATALRENRRQVLELLDWPAIESTRGPATLIPQRRSDIQPATAVV